MQMLESAVTNQRCTDPRPATEAGLAGQRVRLLPERALFWPAAATLFIADTHWGKTAAFRAGGIAVPGGTTAADLQRLSAVLERTGAWRLVILGDLFHARKGRTPETVGAVGAWRAEHPELEVLLVRGNHDLGAGDPPSEWRFRTVDPPYIERPWVLCHHPKGYPDGYSLAGHLHPAVRLEGAGGERVKLPCFWFGPRVGVLPAFGSFTGTEVVRPRPADRVWVLADGEVVRVGE